MTDLGLRDYLHILRRRKWIVLLALVVVPLVAVFFSLRQAAVYESSADVLLRYQSLPSALSGINDPNSYTFYVDPTRSMDTSLQIAGLPVLSQRVEAALRKRGVSTAGVGGVSAGEVGDTDVIRFVSHAGDPTVATETATAYARQFTLYFAQLDSQAINQAITGLQSRITTLQATGGAAARSQVKDLQSKAEQLETLKALQTSTAVVVRTAAGATKIRPTPKKYAVLGIGLGLILGIGLAFLRDAFDTRLRTAEQIGSALKMPLLARIPPPPRKLEREQQLVMIADSTGRGADAFRRLRMNLEFASVGKPSQVTMVTSALPREGKSTTFANLGVAMAQAGKSVALVDLDLHRPMLSKFFRLGSDQLGLTGVVLGHIELDEALVPIRLEPQVPTSGSGDWDGGSSISSKADGGSLVVLPSGALPPDPGEFVGLNAVERVIAALRERVEVVLLDAPPLLAVGDGLTMAGFADALVVAVRSDLARKPVTGELAAMLARLPAVKLGFVLCGDAGLESSSYAYSYGSYAYSDAGEEVRR